MAIWTEWNWETMTEAERDALWSDTNRRRRAEECLKTAETVLATITTAVDALKAEGIVDFTGTDPDNFTVKDSATPTAPTVTVTWAADAQRAYLEQVFQVQFTFLTEYDQEESFQLELARNQYDNDDDYWGRGGASFIASVMGSLLDERNGPEFEALIALNRLTHYRASGVALTPDGWVSEWDDPHTSAGTLARQEQEERDAERARKRQQQEDEDEAWKQFKQEKTRELAAVVKAKREALEARVAGWSARDGYAGTSD